MQDAQNMTDHERRAYDLGIEHAKATASWVIDGNTSQEHTRVRAHPSRGPVVTREARAFVAVCILHAAFCAAWGATLILTF